jgi:hypothetical protein
VWHSRKVGLTSLADSAGIALLTAGQVLANLSGNAGNIPIRISKICCYAIAGTSGQYPPTFLQVNFFNEEFMQTQPNNPAARDSIFDAGGQGNGSPSVGLYIPDSQRQTRDDWGTASTTQLAQAISLPSGGRVLWHVTLQFKFWQLPKDFPLNSQETVRNPSAFSISDLLPKPILSGNSDTNKIAQGFYHSADSSPSFLPPFSFVENVDLNKVFSLATVPLLRMSLSNKLNALPSTALRVELWGPSPL